jgi:hypothetical protein
MADLALVLDCEVLEGITRTNYDGNHYTLALVSVSKSEKRYRNHKEKDFDESASKVRLLI